jgi:hypothetical protein
MQAISPLALTLSEEERDVVIELLDRERTNLPVEIRHSRTGKFRELLKRRLSVVTELLHRLGEDEHSTDPLR